MTQHHETNDAALREACGSGRVSTQRLGIARAAANMAGAFSVDELHHSACEDVAGLGVATVYRAVASMTDCGTLTVVGERDGRTLYVWCTDDGHHHHVICTGCGKVAGIDCPLPKGDALVSATEAGFTVTRHDLTLYGLCAACRERGAR